jgi:hypothetical protein
MDPTIRTTVALYNLRSHHFLKALDGLSAEELLRQVVDSVNPMLWIAGHVTASRCDLSQLVGLEYQAPWKDHFGRGAKLIERESWPDVSEIEAAWSEVSEGLMRRFEGLTEGELSANVAPESFRFSDKTLRGMILFRGYHESYHIGQMAYLRKWLGYQGLVG